MGVLLQIVGIGTVAWLLSKIFRFCTRSSPFDKVPGPNSPSVLTGHFGHMTSRYYWPFLTELCENYGGVVKLQALLGMKMLYISDPAALHSILVDDLGSFDETPRFLIGNQLLFGTGLVAASGDTHRRQRKLLNPAFSPANLRKLTPAFLHVAKLLRNAIATQVKNGPREVDVAAWSGRAALEIIGQGGMGYSFDKLTGSVSNDYAVTLRSLMPTLVTIGLHWFFIPFSLYLGPPKFKRWLLDLYPNQQAQKLKHIVDTIWNKSVNIVKERKTSLEAGDTAVNELVSGGQDIMSILLQANMEASEEDRLPDEQLYAQVNTIIFAASDTTSNALARIIHTLVEHPEAQDKLRSEITAFRVSGSDLTYDELIELPYLDAVCRETLRVYPPVLGVNRVALRDTVLPLSRPITDTEGKTIQELVVTKDSHMVLAIYAFNRSKDIWGADATEWKPDRWLSPLPESAKNASSGGVYFNLMSFAGGPRSCIGFKYAELEMKAFLFYLIASFKFSSGKAEIVWNTSAIVFPSISKQSFKTEMPLRVELVGSVSSEVAG